VIEGRTSVIINRPVAEVFAFTANFETDYLWRNGVIEMRKTSPDPVRVGSTHLEVRKVPGKILESPAIITLYEPNRRVDFQRASGPVRPIGSYRYETVQGGTKLTFILSVPLEGVWKLTTPIIALLVRWVMSGADKEFARLKNLLENSIQVQSELEPVQDNGRI
jgi:hypothetical protein